ncbi:MAG: thymidylate kinase [Acidobacteriia bacterium]|nr:thymidylate kinase [Terriglobia bacterium]
MEGIDGSGKRTQLDLLARALEQRGYRVLQVSFPRYESFFGKLVARFLNGEFGSVGQVDPHLSALLYAGDRLEAKPELESALAAGKIVLADRYIGSNLAHQSERVLAEKRDEFIEWLKHLEYKLYGLPVEDLVIYLRVPVAEAHRLVGLKSARAYTTRQRDILEADIAHLEQTANTYEKLATESNWMRIDCTDTHSGELHSPEEIHQAVLGAVESRALSQGL